MAKQSCYFFYCLPLTREDFTDEFLFPSRHFVELFSGGRQDIDIVWKDYQRSIVDPFTSFRNFFSGHGIRFIENGTFNQFIKLLNETVPDILILFTHCRDGGCKTESIEFFDRMVCTEEILASDFEPHAMLLDISVCRPLYLAEAFPRIHSSFTPFVSAEAKDYSIWLYLYAKIFSLMISRKLRYLDAYLHTLKP